MSTGIIILIIFIVVLLLIGLGVGLYFLLRRKNQQNPPQNPSQNPSQNGSTGTSPCDVLFNKTISAPTFNEAATIAATEIFTLPKDGNNNINGCDGSIALQLITYSNGYNLNCNDLVEKIVSGPNNCNTAYSTVINRYPEYANTCSAGAKDFINIWASGQC